MDRFLTGGHLMKIFDRKTIHILIAAAGIVNLIFLFGFEYKIPKHDETKTGAGSTAIESGPLVDSDYSQEGATDTLSNDSAHSATSGETANVAAEQEESNVGETHYQKCKVITKGNARIRSGPGTEYERVASVTSGTILIITGEENGWYHVHTADFGIEGYILGELVELIEE